MNINNEIFYHYTSISGFSGIVNSRSLWFSEYRFLNDANEFELGYQLFLENVPKEFRGTIDVTFDWILKTHFSFYVLSLSKRHDILSQWRGYADDGRGIALGFSEQFFKFKNINLIKCNYDDHLSIVKTIFPQNSSLFKQCHDVWNENHCLQDLTPIVFSNIQKFEGIVLLLLSLKNKTFKEEEEYRAIKCVKKLENKTRVSEQRLIPYIEVNYWDKDEVDHSLNVPIPKIWLGPKCDPMNKIALQLHPLMFSEVQQFNCGYK